MCFYSSLRVLKRDEVALTPLANPSLKLFCFYPKGAKVTSSSPPGTKTNPLWLYPKGATEACTSLPLCFALALQGHCFALRCPLRGANMPPSVCVVAPLFCFGPSFTPSGFAPKGQLSPIGRKPQLVFPPGQRKTKGEAVPFGDERRAKDSPEGRQAVPLCFASLCPPGNSEPEGQRFRPLGEPKGVKPSVAPSGAKRRQRLSPLGKEPKGVKRSEQPEGNFAATTTLLL